jgi:hypothetical protein
MVDVLDPANIYLVDHAFPPLKSLVLSADSVIGDIVYLIYAPPLENIDQHMIQLCASVCAQLPHAIRILHPSAPQIISEKVKEARDRAPLIIPQISSASKHEKEATSTLSFQKFEPLRMIVTVVTTVSLPPGSGKSTFYSRFSELTGAKYVSSDANFGDRDKFESQFISSVRKCAASPSVAPIVLYDKNIPDNGGWSRLMLILKKCGVPCRVVAIRPLQLTELEIKVQLQIRFSME